VSGASCSGFFVGLFVIHADVGFATLAPLAGITRLAAYEGSFALGAPARRCTLLASPDDPQTPQR
jgi:hypothetical protein